MKRSDFAYDLPAELIAQEPRPRGRSRMMVVTPGKDTPIIEHCTFDAFPQLLGAGDVLVINDTRVIPARLYARPKGQMKKPIELLLTRQREPMLWEAWCKPARRVRAGDQLTFTDTLRATVIEKREDATILVRFSGDAEELERVGVPPLPPYISRPVTREADREAYQTVYAARRGAIAAPTAGLHFTPEILENIGARGVEVVRITLHVGAGTFKPVQVDDVAAHTMDAEEFELSGEAADRLNRALREQRRIVAVGTTSVRTLESAVDESGSFHACRGETRLFIKPGFRFRVVDALLTNFHLPESTLLMLVSAFAGLDTARQAYREAIGHRYLFYSYGDCMFVTARHQYDAVTSQSPATTA